MSRIPPRVAVLGALVATVGALTSHAEGALPPAFGGTLRLPSPEPITSLDPAEAATPFAASIAHAVADPLYEVLADGSLRPVLAAGPPEVTDDVVTIRLRPALRRHGGTTLSAEHVAASLRRGARSRTASWLLAAFTTRGAEPAIDAVGDDAIRLELAAPGLDAGRVLAAAPLAIAAGRDPRRRPVATGPFSGRLSPDGGVELSAFAFAPQGAPYLARIEVTPPAARDDALRAFELARVDFSWHGESLYGGRPVRPARSTEAPTLAPVLLVPGRSGPLADDALFAHLGRAIDRRRLERVGLAATPALAPGLPPPALGTPARPTARVTLRLVVPAGDAFQEALAEALAGPLDEAGFALRVERVAPERYAAAAARGMDLRIAVVSPPLPGSTGLVGAALAAAGQAAEAAAVGREPLDDARRAVLHAPRLRAIVLGHRRSVLSHRADLGGVGFDSTARLDLARLSLPWEGR